MFELEIISDNEVHRRYEMSVVVKVGDKVQWQDGDIGMVTYINEGEFQVYWAEDDKLVNHYSSMDVLSGKMLVLESENQ